MKNQKENDRLKFTRLVEWMNENNMLNNDLGIIDYEVAEMFLETDAYKRFESEMNKKKNDNYNLNKPIFLDSEIVKLAEEFSKNYKKLSVGEYFSDDKKYCIKFLKRIKDNNGINLNTGARISKHTGVIEIDKFIFKDKEYTNDFLFFIILWCVVCKEQKDTGNIKNADKITFEYYLTTNRSIKNVMTGWRKLFILTPSDLNKERYELMVNMLKKS